MGKRWKNKRYVRVSSFFMLHVAVINLFKNECLLRPWYAPRVIWKLSLPAGRSGTASCADRRYRSPPLPSVHNHWHAARSYQYNTIHKIEQTTLFCKSHLTFFSLVVRRTEVSFHGHEASLKTVWVHQQDLNSTSWAVAQPWPYHIKNRLLIIQTSNKRKLRKLTCFICSCYFTCRNANKQNRTNS